MLYKLVNKEIVPVDGNSREAIQDWMQWYEMTDERHISMTQIGNIIVSTVFLGIDYGIIIEKPVLFETRLVDTDTSFDYFERCFTYAEALQQHEKIAGMAKETITEWKKITANS